MMSLGRYDFNNKETEAKKSLAEFFGLLVRVDQRINPELYTFKSEKQIEIGVPQIYPQNSVDSSIKRVKNALGGALISSLANSTFKTKFDQRG